MRSLTIGKIAERAAVGVETIRFYERKGLIPRPPRPHRGFRAYPADTIARIRFIRQAQGLGFTLREIEELLSLRTDPAADCAAVREQAAAKLQDVIAKTERLQRIRGALETLIAACPGKGDVTACSILDGLTETAAKTAPLTSSRSRKRATWRTNMKKMLVTIAGMHCDGCAETIKALLKMEPGVQTSAVSFKERNARILYDPATTSEQRLITAIERGGYKAARQT